MPIDILQNDAQLDGKAGTLGAMRFLDSSFAALNSRIGPVRTSDLAAERARQLHSRQLQLAPRARLVLTVTEVSHWLDQ
jgi:hypothetical protein